MKPITVKAVFTPNAKSFFDALKELIRQKYS